MFSQSAASTELVLGLIPPPLLPCFAPVTYWEVVPNGVELFPDWRPLRLPTIHVKAPTMPSCSQCFRVVFPAQNVRKGGPVVQEAHPNLSVQQPETFLYLGPE